MTLAQTALSMQLEKALQPDGPRHQIPNQCELPVVFAGGIDLFSDKYARKELPSGTPSGNSQPARDIVAWVLQEMLIAYNTAYR
jgi:hypothetical protein